MTQTHITASERTQLSLKLRSVLLKTKQRSIWCHMCKAFDYLKSVDKLQNIIVVGVSPPFALITACTRAGTDSTSVCANPADSCYPSMKWQRSCKASGVFEVNILGQLKTNPCSSSLFLRGQCAKTPNASQKMDQLCPKHDQEDPKLLHLL